MKSIGQKYSEEESDICPIYSRPSHGVNGVQINLLVNWYRMNMKLYGREVYEYQVIVTKCNQNRMMGGRPRNAHLSSSSNAVIKNRDVLRILFWETVRSNEKIFGPYTEIVFDDFNCAYSLNIWKLDRNSFCFTTRHPENPKMSVKIVVTGSTRFDFNIFSEDICTKNRSSILLKNLLTQHVRYYPEQNNLQERMFTSRWETSRGSIYFIPNQEGDPEIHIAPGIRAWLGIYASIKTMENYDTAVNFGLVNKLFYKPRMNLITYYFDVLQDLGLYKRRDHSFLRKMGMNKQQRETMTDKLSGIRVKTNYALLQRREGTPFLGERTYKFIKVADGCPKVVRWRNGKTIEETYHLLGQRLSYPGLPLCQVKNGNIKEFLPLEMLYIHEKPQSYNKTLDFLTKLKFIKGTCRLPDRHKMFTNVMFDMMEFDSNSCNFLKSFGCDFGIKPRMIECSGRVLDSPIIVDKEGIPVEVDANKRSFKMKQLNVTSTKKLVCVILTMCSSKNKEPCIQIDLAREFFRVLIEKCQEKSILISERLLLEAYQTCEEDAQPHDEGFKNPEIISVRTAVEKAKSLFDQGRDKNNEILLILVFHSRVYNTYGLVKSLCDNEYGIVSQVVDEESVRKAVSGSKLSIYYNLALKINAKLGGINHSTVLNRKLTGENTGSNKKSGSVMYVGIDVTHPTNTSELTYDRKDISIACMVGSLNLEATKYSSEVFAQMKPRETIECFDRQFSQLMFRFKECSNTWPEHVVVLRDGTSESEMLRTAYIELKWIKDTWARLTDGTLQPTFTYIVIQKRHLTRFYNIVKDGEKEIVRNVPSGTLVDSGIVSPTMFDFYLASHFGAIGTTRPAHYTVVVDEWKLTPDEIYEMCYRLCFVYARCQMPVSIPAPVYYAHLACERAKEIYKVFRRSNMYNDSLTDEQLKYLIEEKLAVHGSYPGMHFV